MESTNGPLGIVGPLVGVDERDEKAGRFCGWKRLLDADSCWLRGWEGFVETSVAASEARDKDAGLMGRLSFLKNRGFTFVVCWRGLRSKTEE